MALQKKKKKNIKPIPFDIYIKLVPTSERFLLKSVNSDMRVNELKCYAELVVGIPSNLQRLQYLDEGDMMDDSDLKYNDVVAGATINLKIWRNWETLVAAAARGDVDAVFKQDIVISKDWEKLDPLLYKSKVNVARDRAAVALFIAAHRGNSQLIRSLIDNANANVNMKTPYGRSPLHVAASQGHSISIDTMLEKGAAIDDPDSQGKTPLMIASQCGFKDSERHLFLFQWQQRAAKIKRRKKSSSLMMHQQFDSNFPVWFKGTQAQLYFCQTLPPGEFAGTGLSAPRRAPPEAQRGLERRSTSDLELPPINEGMPSRHGKKFIFQGHDMHGMWIRDSGLGIWIRDHGIWIRDLGIWIRDHGIWIRDLGIGISSKSQSFNLVSENNQGFIAPAYHVTTLKFTFEPDNTPLA